MDSYAHVRAITMTASEAISAGRADYFEALQTAIALVLPTVARVSPHNPMLRWFLSGQLLPASARMSDLVDTRSFRRGPVYNELFRAVGARLQVGIPTVINDGRLAGRGWAMNRSDRDFSDDEVALLVALQPSLVLLEDLVQRSTPDAGAVGIDPVWDSLTSRQRQVAELLTARRVARNVTTASS